MTRPVGTWLVCPNCGRPNFRGAITCPRCGRSLDEAPPNPTRDEPHDPYEPPNSPPISYRTFSIGSILLVIVPIAICFAVAKVNPPNGIVLAVLTAPALARTIVVVSVRKSRGSPMGVYGTVWTFFGSFALMGVIGVASGIAFLACCATVGLPTNNLSIGLIGGAVGAAVVAIFLFTLMIRRVIRSESSKENRQ